MSLKPKDNVCRALFGAIAITLTFGAGQLAMGRDLSSPAPPETAVNRTAKTDRALVPPGSTQTRTVLLQLNNLSDTSVLLRVPVAMEVRNTPAPSMLKSRDRKSAVACEPPVSVLTEIAKQLLPGRCVT